jgi:hypothetical protein
MTGAQNFLVFQCEMQHPTFGGRLKSAKQVPKLLQNLHLRPLKYSELHYSGNSVTKNLLFMPQFNYC